MLKKSCYDVDFTGFAYLYPICVLYYSSIEGGGRGLQALSAKLTMLISHTGCHSYQSSLGKPAQIQKPSAQILKPYHQYGKARKTMI